MKRMTWFALLLVLALAVSPLSALAAYNDHTAYSQFPLVADGEKLTVTVATPRNDTYGIDAEDMWFWIWSEQATGIDFEVEQIGGSAMKERKSLMLASADLPDFLIGITMSADELVKYGVGEGLFKDLTPFINEDVTPWLCKWLAEYPEAKALCTTPDGKMYTLPGFVDYYIISGEPCIRYYTPALEGMELPKTLDEFTALMYSIKEKNPDVNPLGGCEKGADPRFFILNAFGYLTSNSVGNGVALKNDQPVIPAYDEEYVEVLKLLNQYYKDGIITPDFFTMDDTTLKAKVANLEMVTYANAPYTANADISFFQSWDAFSPVTSEYNDEPMTYDNANHIHIGNFEISAICDDKKAETIMRYVDFFFSDLGGMYFWEGPAATSADTLGLVGGYYFEGETTIYADAANGKYANNSAYLHAATIGNPKLGNRSHPITKEIFDLGVTCRPEMRSYFGGDGVNIIPYQYAPENASGWDLGRILENVQPYVKTGYPSVVYRDEDTVVEMSDLQSVLNPYIQTEVAKFITGVRPLDEFEAFRGELKSMGVEDLLAIYQEGYEAYLSNLE